MELTVGDKEMLVLLIDQSIERNNEAVTDMIAEGRASEGVIATQKAWVEQVNCNLRNIKDKLKE